MDTNSQEWMDVCLMRWFFVTYHTQEQRQAWLRKMRKKWGDRRVDDLELIARREWKSRKEWMHNTNEIYRGLRDETTND